LSNTLIAGDLTVDGTFSVTSGNTINSIDTLYLQTNPLASLVDIFNGAITMDNSGKIQAKVVAANEFQAVGGQSIGEGKIFTGTKEVFIATPLVKSNSRILITPTKESNQVLSVIDKVTDFGFTVTVPNVVAQDLSFDWFIINEIAGVEN
jgi:hypothetical protein